MARLCGASCGMLVFSATIFIGLFDGASVERIILRALVGLFGGCILGCFAGTLALHVVQDNLPKPEKNTELAEAQP